MIRAAAIILALSLPLAPAAHADVIGQMTTAEPLTEARIAQFPADQRALWQAYLARSKALMAADKAALIAELDGGPPPPGPGKGVSGGAGMPLDKPADWYGSPEARHAADTIVSFQTPAGGWSKNMDRSGAARLSGQSYANIEKLPATWSTDIRADDPSWAYVGTIDNNATTSELRFLARVQAALPGVEGDRYRAAFEKGVRYLLTAQYPNGGWPQVFPLQGGYHDAITYNDDAMTDVILVLDNTAARQGDYAFVPAPLGVEARAAVDRAIAMILATQVKVNGRLTGWGQQHDMLTLVPVGARNFEPASLSSSESAGLLALLMRRPNPSPEIVAAVEAGIAWLQSAAIADVEWKAVDPALGRQLSAKPGAGPLWSRFYDLKTLKPVFGDRDKTIHDDVNELSLERRNGYSWYGSGPGKVVKMFGPWKAKLAGAAGK